MSKRKLRHWTARHTCKSVVLNTFKELKEIVSEGLRGSMRTVSHQIEKTNKNRNNFFKNSGVENA